jgi:hypothetical protein
MRQRIKLFVLTAFVVFATLARLTFFVPSVAAKPAFMDRYSRDPYARAELSRKCTVCHVGRGGGERNDFGEAFEDAGFRITPKLREKFPALFTRDSR